MSEIGWNFPLTGGGVAPGLNNAGIVTFQGSRMAALARETIQNSLDAKASMNPVHVEFELRSIPRAQYPGSDEMAKILEACMAAAGTNDKFLSIINSASELLEQDEIPFLRVWDRETTGLYGDKWELLLKREGDTDKDAGSGGSFGIGRNAPFAVSPLRTVFYWTRCGHDADRRAAFQGKSILMSHDTGSGRTQATGFFGIRHDCLELADDQIPEPFARIEGRQRRGDGTSLWIPGFRDEGTWQERVAASVIAYYFSALRKGELTVTVDPGNSIDDDALLAIDAESLDHWFDHLSAVTGLESDLTDALDIARHFLVLLNEGGDVRTFKQDIPLLGRVELRVRVNDDLPRHVARNVGLVRKTGMLITTEQPGLIRFNEFDPFIALCRLDDEAGNEWLRRMENPKHDKFEPEQIEDEDQRRQARAALKGLTDWIREMIRSVAVPQISPTPTAIDELAEYLPDTVPDDDFDVPGDEDEPNLGEAVKLRMPRMRRPWKPSKPSPKPQIEIEDFRTIPVKGASNEVTVSFTPLESGDAELRFGEAGDSDPMPIDEVRVLTTGGGAIDASSFPLIARQRVHLRLRCEESLADRSLYIQALKAVG